MSNLRPLAVPFAFALVCLGCDRPAEPLADVSPPTEQTAPEPTPSPTRLKLDITFTPRGAAEVKRHLADFPGHHVRATVKGGGCSGFTNALDLDDRFDPAVDVDCHSHGVRIVTDKRSALYLAGSVIDFISDGTKRGFSIDNPNAKRQPPPDAKE
jgi:iron-sulfur cluster assembly protein